MCARREEQHVSGRMYNAVQGLAETLLTLDVPGRICGPDMKPGQRVRLAPLGCAMLTTLLSFPQVSGHIMLLCSPFLLVCLQ